MRTQDPDTQDIESLQKEIKICKAQYDCEIFGYQASLSTVLKSHVTRKHKPEGLRKYKYFESYLQKSPISDQRMESPNKDNEFETSSEDSLTKENERSLLILSKFKCKDCNKYFQQDSMIELHMIENHIIEENFTEYFSCDKTFNSDDVIFARYHVRWDHGVVGNNGTTMAFCNICHNELLEIALYEACGDEKLFSLSTFTVILYNIVTYKCGKS